MSSILKALKQQQSPIVRTQSQLNNELFAAQKNSASGAAKWAIGACVAAIACSLVVLYLPLGEQDNAVAQQAQQPEVYRWGDAATVPTIDWAAAPEPKPAEPEPIIVNPRGQAAQQPASQQDALATEGISEDLLSRFEQAVKATADAKQNDVDSVIPTLSKLNPSLQRQIRAFTYDAHMYVSDESRRWIELDQQKLMVGDQFRDMQVVKIEPQRVVLRRQGKLFAVEALVDWKGAQ
ncbi:MULTISPECIES: general secretion pathway protein GspB [Idiomarina]|uniref:general secretion pathway protein GspB n=1 Tax=Idiomarina TaxID=135575 RepID=UPI000795A36A|nr:MULTISPECIES: general secretion pathway protein GspB [unclassified Idiomarina]KXS35023.1 MAG: General secretion pathway protein B [Idiomarina sp. T82-3]MAD53763.1 general secretion pathway protein GspB [Idiomarinaceae bacterium]|tara:strand:+ start:8165 stop:8872 length:708 start_codon:yes stop_codon:yes gene_type:complete